MLLFSLKTKLPRVQHIFVLMHFLFCLHIMDENIFVLMHIFILVADYGREGPIDAKMKTRV